MEANEQHDGIIRRDFNMFKYNVLHIIFTFVTEKSPYRVVKDKTPLDVSIGKPLLFNSQCCAKP